MSVQGKSNFRALRFAGLVTLAGIAVAAFLVIGSYLYWQSEKKNESDTVRAVQDMRFRLDKLRRERDDLRNSEDTYKRLVARGVFLPEHRIDFVEALATLDRRHRLANLEYDIAPQRAIRMGAGPGYLGVDVMASRVRLELGGYHDGDLIAFLDEFPRIQRGFFPIDRCSIRRNGEFEQRQRARAALAAQASAAMSQAGKPAPREAPPREEEEARPIASVIADCTLEWITLVDKSVPRPVAAAPMGSRPQ